MPQIPLWVEKVGRQSGRDHLGLQSVGQGMLEELTLGISNITRRICYYPFFCYVIKSFFDSDTDKSNKNYQLHLKKMSLLYMLSMASKHLSESNSGIDGIEFARNNLSSILNGHKVISESFFSEREYLNNNWIYKAKLENLNLLYFGDDTSIPSLVDPFGKQLATYFEEMLREKLAVDFSIEYITTDKLEEIEKKCCFHRIKEHENLRQLLEDIFFARPFTSVSLQTNRRYTFVLLLLFLEQSNIHDLYQFERWVYANQVLPDKLYHIKKLWKLLFARNYFVFSVESLFLFFLFSIQVQPQSLSQFFSSIEVMLKEKSDSGNIYIRLLAENYSLPLKLAIENIYGSITLTDNHDLYESNLIKTIKETNGHITLENYQIYFIQSVFCILSLYYQYQYHNVKSFDDDELRFLQFGETFRLSLKTFFSNIEDALYEGKSLQIFIEDFYQTQVLPRHQLIATEKYYSEGIDTFHFQCEDDVYTAVNRPDQFQPTFNALKFSEMINFFEDLDLIIKNSEKRYKITEKGQKVKNEFYE